MKLDDVHCEDCGRGPYETRMERTQKCASCHDYEKRHGSRRPANEPPRQYRPFDHQVHVCDHCGGYKAHNASRCRECSDRAAVGREQRRTTVEDNRAGLTDWLRSRKTRKALV